jgi:hypothetical protein
MTQGVIGVILALEGAGMSIEQTEIRINLIEIVGKGFTIKVLKDVQLVQCFETRDSVSWV